MKYVKCKLCGEEHPLGGCPKFKTKPRSAMQRLMAQPPKKKTQTPPERRGS